MIVKTRNKNKGNSAQITQLWEDAFPHTSFTPRLDCLLGVRFPSILEESSSADSRTTVCRYYLLKLTQLLNFRVCDKVIPRRRKKVIFVDVLSNVQMPQPKGLMLNKDTDLIYFLLQ